MPTYGYSSGIYPSDSITVNSGDTVQIGISFNATVGIVGNYDDANGTATAGQVTEVTSSRDARDKFGEGSELHRAVEQAYANGAVTVFAYPLPKTETTETGLSGSGTLSNTPVTDPRVTTSEITVKDTTASADETVDIDYSSVQQNTSLNTASADEFKINPINGDFQDDGTGNTYDVTYEYSTSTEWNDGVDALANEDVRFLVALTEEEGRQNDAVIKANTEAQDFDFFRVVSNAPPGVEPASDPDNVQDGEYSHNFDESRLVLAASARGYAGSDGSEEVRTAATYGGKLAGKTLGDSTTYESVSGLLSLNREYSVSEAEDWINNGVTPIRQTNNIFVVKDMTTSSDSRFERVFATEIVDEATEGSHQIAQSFIGELNTQDNRRNLEDNHSILYEGFLEEEPPLLDNYTVNVTESSTNENEVDVDIGLDVVNVIDIVDVNITVGDVITQEQG